ncbi:hypothetical protein L1286_17035 [Pseudoalteromonas sp. SMS1]|uniref:hypothetical protein n=1 Tax=Pseudoalteromonas sp. SMS1 TaxID=2908894 RepID=UPI001F180B26|nr:hypothetical protein [Pseudoalteromonas sp. SMS1]MCF2859191.1 hypothetical protein [Pseudoalteromonas sp. SMS1]
MELTKQVTRFVRKHQNIAFLSAVLTFLAPLIPIIFSFYQQEPVTSTNVINHIELNIKSENALTDHPPAKQPPAKQIKHQPENLLNQYEIVIFSQNPASASTKNVHAALSKLGVQVNIKEDLLKTPQKTIKYASSEPREVIDKILSQLPYEFVEHQYTEFSTPIYSVHIFI